MPITTAEINALAASPNLHNPNSTIERNTAIQMPNKTKLAARIQECIRLCEILQQHRISYSSKYQFDLSICIQLWASVHFRRALAYYRLIYINNDNAAYLHGSAMLLLANESCQNFLTTPNAHEHLMSWVTVLNQYLAAQSDLRVDANNYCHILCDFLTHISRITDKQDIKQTASKILLICSALQDPTLNQPLQALQPTDTSSLDLELGQAFRSENTVSPPAVLTRALLSGNIITRAFDSSQEPNYVCTIL